MIRLLDLLLEPFARDAFTLVRRFPLIYSVASFNNITICIVYANSRSRQIRSPNGASCYDNDAEPRTLELRDHHHLEDRSFRRTALILGRRTRFRNPTRRIASLGDSKVRARRNRCRCVSAPITLDPKTDRGIDEEGPTEGVHRAPLRRRLASRRGVDDGDDTRDARFLLIIGPTQYP